MRDLSRRVERLEAGEPRIVCIWKGARDPDEVMRERFGSTEAPPGVTVYLMSWGDGSGDLDRPTACELVAAR